MVLTKGRSLSRKFIVLSENHPLPVILYRKSVYFSRCMLYIELYFFFSRVKFLLGKKSSDSKNLFVWIDVL